MALPVVPLPLDIEMWLGGQWVPVTSAPVLRRDMVTITRGRANESSQADRSTCDFSLNNRNGHFSPRNPMSPYFGDIGRNTPVRAAVRTGDTYLQIPGTGGRATCPDAAPLGITGDIDIRIELTLDSWRRETSPAGRYVTAGDQRSWALWISSTGDLWFTWSVLGTLASNLSLGSSVPLPAPASGRQAIRVTLDVNNGSGGHTATFYTAPSISGPWTQLGDPRTDTGTTSIFDSTVGLEVGEIWNRYYAATGRVHAFELRNGINGTVVANPVFTTQTPGAASFADTASSPNTWTMSNGASLSNRRYRFWGEIGSLPPRWDITGTDVWVPVQAAGIMRRLGQGSAPFASVLYRGHLLDTSGLVAYWPMEDAAGATSIAPALDHGPMTVIGTPDLAAFDGFVSSSPIPVLAGASLRGAAPAYTDTGQTQLRWVMTVPSGGAENGQTIVLAYTTGSVRRWEVVYGTGGTLMLRAFDQGGAQLFTSGAISFSINGKPCEISLELRQVGANIDYAIATLEVGATTGLAHNGTLNAHTVGRVGIVMVSPGGGISAIAIGHLSVQNEVTGLFDLADQINGWRGETAGRRIERLCREEGITFHARGDLDDTARMGAQRPDGLLALLREAADTDGGMLYEPREVLGLGYRTRTSLYNQPATVALDYAANHLVGELQPTDDDELTRNDVTVSRPDGSSARAVLETGALSILPPPNGVGRYEDSPPAINVEHDLDLFDQAGWRLRLGTVDEARYPTLSVNLARTQISGDAALFATIVGAEVGDRVTVAHLPAWLPPEPISQLIQGSTERLGNFEWDFSWNCAPASPYEVARYGTGNLIGNGSFEVNTTGWVAGSNASIARVTSVSYAGAASLSVTRTASNPPFSLYAAEAQDVAGAGTLGDVVTLSAWIRIPAASLPHVVGVMIGGIGTDFQFAPTVGLVADTWYRIERTVSLTADLDNVQVQFWTSNGHSNGQVVGYIDAVSARNAETAGEPDRYQPHECTLASGVTSTATTLSVATTGPLWTTDPGELPMDIVVGGERMTVTAISGSSSPQSFTVTRSANGIVKSHSSGAAVMLARPSVYAL